ncbi:MAG: UvrD-helicase domain-containing protein [Candidatus Omnitrophica bacterium]|nr:UvrD-helicase domain-containing protein [Candidatus Omnitrophota bacterium]MDD5671017.1 UvrD-helicase domain-containing protein [Candidatus Omnitrophota bacterium]
MKDKNTDTEVDLTKIQKAAVEAAGKNVLVSAGAGTGKTRVLVERFLQFVLSGRARPDEILTLTYTEKAANEMKARIFKRLGALGLEQAKYGLESAYISTIHAFASRVLREHPIEAGVDPDFRVLEEEESDYLKEQALDECIEAACLPASETFELLSVYGERDIRSGLIKILEAARHEGQNLADFFIRRPAPAVYDPEKIASVRDLFTKLGEPALAADWRRWTQDTWDWETAGMFGEWSSSFGRRGGKEAKADWKEIATVCKDYYAFRLDEFALVWQARLEKLALGFEAAYEARKKERGFLDFDDLQIRALGLFKKESAVHRKLLQTYRERFRYVLVDEFQDTNFLQLELIELLSSGSNLFLVGDYKQSIYGFRGAEPEVFLRKEREYLQEDKGARIPLLENFRTEAPVVDFLNELFRHLWKEDGLPMEDLIARVDGSAQSSVEWMSTKLEAGENLDAGRLKEAASLADRIRALHDDGVPYGDIALLFQAMTSTGIYEQALKKVGIPYFVIAGRSFYQQPEIRDILSFLAYLENPRADIPLAASLRSPLFQVRDDTLFWLAKSAKAGNHYAPLFDGVRTFESIAEIAEDEKEKLRFFVRVSEDLLLHKDQLRLAELLEKIIALTGYELIALADPQGVRRYANLRKLVNLAREYETHEPMTPGAFLRTLSRLETREVRESEAQVEAERSGRVVRLLSIHKAKGLEFPVVFVADMARERQSSDCKTVLAETRLGYALRVRNEKTLEMEEPRSWRVIEEAQKRKGKKEWKRLFYVAATRAKTKLIFSGVSKERTKEKESFYDMSSWTEWLAALPQELQVQIEKSASPRNFPHKAKLPLVERRRFRECFETFDPQPAGRLFKSAAEEGCALKETEIILAGLTSRKMTPSRVIDLPVTGYAVYRKDPQHYHRVYEIGYPDRSHEEEKGAPAIEGGEISRADFGTAMHRCLERMDFRNPPRLTEEYVWQYFQGMDAARLREARGVLKNFLESSLLGRLARARVIKKEIPFVLNERHGLVHGVIDVLFQDEKGAWHILDYKTAEGDRAKVKEAGYDLQIEIYAYAVHEILNLVPASGMLYFLLNGWEYCMDFKRETLAGVSIHLKQMQEEILEIRGRRSGNQP